MCPNPYTTTAQGNNIKWRRDILEVVARLPGTQILRIGTVTISMRLEQMGLGFSYCLPPRPSTPHYLTSHTCLRHHSWSPIHHHDVSRSPLALRSWPPWPATPLPNQFDAGSPFHSAMQGQNHTIVHPPALDIDPAGLPAQAAWHVGVFSSLAQPANSSVVGVQGNSIELTVSPHHGPTMSLIISPPQVADSDNAPAQKNDHGN